MGRCSLSPLLISFLHKARPHHNEWNEIYGRERNFGIFAISVLERERGSERARDDAPPTVIAPVPFHFHAPGSEEILPGHQRSNSSYYCHRREPKRERDGMCLAWGPRVEINNGHFRNSDACQCAYVRLWMDPGMPKGVLSVRLPFFFGVSFL